MRPVQGFDMKSWHDLRIKASSDHSKVALVPLTIHVTEVVLLQFDEEACLTMPLL